MAEEKPETKEVKKEVKSYSVGAVATQTERVIIDSKGNVIDNLEVLTWIMNKLEKIEKAVA